MKNSISLIGMAGAGKTSVGKALSLELGYEFLDTDKIIEISYGKSKDIIDSEGKDRFRAIEEEVLLSTKFKNTLLATGGSAVFSPLAMEHIRDYSDIIYLEVSFENISERVLDFEERGFIKESHQSIKEAYEERLVLYEKYADYSLTNNDSVEACVQKIIALLDL
ncbi:MAG: shikimate kinase [Pseudomonadota bacterium]|nr:shikimate kinase [Pseudomonadota bacterium]